MRLTPTVRPQVGGVLPSAHSASERVQHAIVPDETVRPFLDGWGLSGGGSPEGHCSQSSVRSFGRHAFISLRPFAPPALPGFNATMNALTPAHRSVPEVVSASSCLSRCPILHRSLDCCVWLPRPQFPRVVTDVMSRYPCFLCCTFRPFCLQPPLAVPMLRLGFAASGVPSNASHHAESDRVVRPCVIGFRHSLAGSPRQQAESSLRRLTEVNLYCGLDVRLRLLPTPPHGDAVTIGYEGPDVPGEDFHLANATTLQAH